MNAIWSVEEEDYVLQNASRLTDEALAAELSAHFGRTVTRAAARQKRRSLGLRKLPGRGVCALDTFELPKAALPLCV